MKNGFSFTLIFTLLFTLIFIVSGIFLGTLNAQVDFEPQTAITQPFTIFHNCVVDMNGDHLDDIVGIGAQSLNIAYQTATGFEYKKINQDFEVQPDWSICAGDIDGNGFNDLAIGGSVAVSFVYANNNGSAYTEVVKDDYIFVQRTTFADIDNDGHLDAFICHDEDENHPFRNDGTGHLNLDYDLLKTPEDTPGNYMASWVDYDNDNDMDMYLTKCVQGAVLGDITRTNLLYNNDGNGNYTEVGAVANMDDNDQSWVTSFEDFDGDGDFDAFILNHETANRLMRNNGDGTFTDVINGSGIIAAELMAFQCLTADFDNDGDVDILRDMPNVFYYNNGDMTFTREMTDVTPGAMGDLNNDGFIDIALQNTVYYNQKNNNHWLRVNTVGRESNANGLGARVELYGEWGMMLREVRATQSWSPMSTLGTHFGLGQYTVIDSLVIGWPSGLRQVILQPSIDQALTVDELDCPTDLLEVGLSGSALICGGGELTLTAEVVSGSYLWSNGETTQSITTDATGGYNVTITTPDGCTQKSAVVEVINTSEPSGVIAPDGTLLCGSPVRLQTDSVLPVVWSNGKTTPTIWVDEEGDYFAAILNACGESVNSNIITLEALNVEVPVAEDIYTEETDLLVISVPGELVIWWDAEEGGNFLFSGNDYFLSNVTTDLTFWVQNVTILANGQQCYSERVPINVYLITATAEQERALGLKLYPNPTRETLHIKLDQPQSLNAAILRDIHGQQVANYDAKTLSAGQISTEGLASGIYMLEMLIDDLQVVRKVVIAE